jgi:integrase
MKALRRAADEGSKPFSVSRGSVLIKGYPLARGLWQLSWYAPDGTRQRRAFRDAAEARRFAAQKASELAGQRSHVRTLTPEEAADYEAAIAKLPAESSLVEAVEFFVARHPIRFQQKSVDEVVSMLLDDLKCRGLSGAYQRSASVNLRRFARDFACPIASVSGILFRSWLRELGVAPKTQQGIRGLVVKLFNFAAAQKLVAREHALEIAEVETPKIVIGNVPTFTSADVLKLFATATRAELPTLVLLTFCPLRTAEVARLDWKDVRLAERVLIVNASVAKISVRRVVPLPEAAVQWLHGHSRASGPIWPEQPDPYGDRLAHRLPLLAKAAGVAYGKNAFRHSVISALMATEQDAARVSLWAGNSPRVVATNYSARWTPAQGKEWFSVYPTGCNRPREVGDPDPPAMSTISAGHNDV